MSCQRSPRIYPQDTPAQVAYIHIRACKVGCRIASRLGLYTRVGTLSIGMCAIMYISKFKGHPIIARKLDRGSYVRDESLQWLDYSIAKDSWQNKETFNKSVREDLLKKGDPSAKFYESESYHEFVKKIFPRVV